MEAVTVQTKVREFFARTDLEFLDCPLCTLPLRKQTCKIRQTKRGHWAIREAEESDVIADLFRGCEGCEHFHPSERRQGKLSMREINHKVHGLSPKPQNRLTPEDLERMAMTAKIERLTKLIDSRLV